MNKPKLTIGVINKEIVLELEWESDGVRYVRHVYAIKNGIIDYETGKRFVPDPDQTEQFPIKDCVAWDSGDEQDAIANVIIRGQLSDDRYVVECETGVIMFTDSYKEINLKPMTAKEIANRVCRQAEIGGIIGIIELKDEIKARGVEGDD